MGCRYLQATDRLLLEFIRVGAPHGHAELHCLTFRLAARQDAHDESRSHTPKHPRHGVGVRSGGRLHAFRIAADETMRSDNYMRRS